MIVEISGAATSLRATWELAKLAVEARDDAKVQAAVIEANMKLLDLMTASFALQEKTQALAAQLAEAQRELADVKAQANDRALYALHEIRPGAFVYAPKDAGNTAHPSHYLCQPCYDKAAKAVLRYLSPGAGRHGRWTCPNEAGHEIVHEGTAKPHPPLRRGLIGGVT